MANTGEQLPKDAALRLTYAALGARLGISPDAARMLARRRDWQRVIANRRGAPTIVVVPEDELTSEQWREGERDPNFPDARANEAEELVELAERRANEAEEHAERAEQRAVESERRADEANHRADAAQALADRSMALLADAGTAIVEERRRADALRTTIDELKAGQTLMADMHAKELAAARDQLERVRDAAEGLRQAEEVRKARGLVARLRAAWQGD